MQYETVIGIEVHVQLDTKSKLFCSCSTEFGAEANSLVCPICLGLPGALPVLNKEALNQAIRAGLALGCDIQRVSSFDRKTYFYPDLPKAYQTTQMARTICRGGGLTIEKEGGEKKFINISEIHIEEDAGKLVHGENMSDPNSSYVDLNRSSMPLIEIVSKPEIGSAEEARLYMQKMRTILMYAGVSDVNMEEGSLRCDANVSIKPVGQKELGTRTEIKNMNSFRGVQRAVEYEIHRQEQVLRGGGEVLQETRLWDNDASVTVAMRLKDDADGYRYFPCPDLLPVIISNEHIQELQDKLPEMPDSKRERFLTQYELSAYDAGLLISDVNYANYYEEAVTAYNSPKGVANWIMSEVLRAVNDKNVGIYEVGISPQHLAELVKLVEDDTISGKQGKELILDAMQSGKSPAAIVKDKGMAQESDAGALEAIIQKVLDDNPDEVERFKGGDKRLQGFFVGQVMKVSQGKANPKMVNQILGKLLS